MPEYVVDCEQLPYGDGMTIVLPISINGHVHERLVRCQDCVYCDPMMDGLRCLYRPHLIHWTGPEDYCSSARPRDGDG